MSKNKRQQQANEEDNRRSRKEVLIARKEAEQTRGIRIAIGMVAGLILVILIIAVVNELVISPNREVATVAGEKISLNDFQDRVEFERAQRIILLEGQLEAFGNDVGIIQQFAGQMIIDMLPQNSDTFGETVLDQMVAEILIERAASERGITVSETDVDEAVGAEFGFFGGGLPTPLPTATETIVPTPSLTPIPTAVITEELPAPTSLPDPTVGPTNTPLPTATPVSEAVFQEEFSEFIADYTAFGISEARYREGIRMRLLRERVTDALVEEQALSAEAEHANFFVIATSDEAEANEIAGMIETGGYLPVWNEIRSRPFDPEAASTALAAEILQRRQDDLSETFGSEVADAAFGLDVDTPSAIITAVGQDGTQQYFIIMVSGREMLALDGAALDELKQEALFAYLEEMREGNVVVGDFWRGRVPTLPVLDSKFLAQPTATPVVIQPEVPEIPEIPTDQ